MTHTFSGKIYFHTLLVALLFLAVPGRPAVPPDFRGQLSAWSGATNQRSQWRAPSGVRYLPEISIGQHITNDSFIDASFSVNSYFATDFKTGRGKAKLYRLKVRFATAQSETRIGLQKISFGPAQLLRALMWFDRIDPRDPLRMSDGVYAARFKYNFLNNANLWLWTLYGNNKTRGYEVFPTARNTPEFGGRFQYPMLRGDVSVTLHRRRVNVDSFQYRENRLALDGRWDMVLGWWFETVVQQQTSACLPYQWNKMLTVGADYTFPMKNGLYVLAEHMAISTSTDFLQNGEDRQFSASLLSYPLGIFDTVRWLGYFSWQDNTFYQYLAWQRTYDNFSFNLSLFHYPSRSLEGVQSNIHVPVTGYGAQLMIIYNH